MTQLPHRDLEPGSRMVGRAPDASGRDLASELAIARIKLRRQRLVNLVLLGLAISIPFHIAIIIYLSSLYMDRPVAVVQVSPPIEMSIVPEEQLEEFLEQVEVPDPLDPMLSADAPGEDTLDPLDVEAPTSTDTSLRASGALSAGGADSSDGGGGMLGSGTGGTSFFGIGGRGRRFAYIVDRSSSMQQVRKLEVVKDELRRSIRALPDFASFLIYFYANDYVTPEFQDDWIRARPREISRVRRWIDGQVPGGSTQPMSSFMSVLSMEPRPDVIFFLTDGIIPEDTAAKIRQYNSTGRVIPINTIAFGSPAGQEQLKQIAADSGGVYRFVPVGGATR